MKIWLQLEVASDENTRQRAAKILSRAGDQIDHEDIPMIVTMLSAGDLDELLSVQRGSQQRVTKEGLKNAYVGYGTYFRTYAYKAKLALDDKAQFTRRDAERVLKRLVAFIYFDNMMTKASHDDARRPSLSRTQIESEHMPSGGSYTPRAYRDSMNAMAYAMLSGKDEVTFEGRDGKPVTVKTGVGGGFDLADTDVGSAASHATLDNYLGYTRGKTPITSTAERDAYMKASDTVYEAMLDKVLSDPDFPNKIATILSKFAEHLTNEGFDAGSSGSHVDDASVESTLKGMFG